MDHKLSSNVYAQIHKQNSDMLEGILELRPFSRFWPLANRHFDFCVLLLPGVAEHQRFLRGLLESWHASYCASLFEHAP